MFYQNISLHEGFLESVPTILIMTVIWRAALGQVMSDNDNNENFTAASPSGSLYRIIFAKETPGEFFTFYSIRIISAGYLQPLVENLDNESPS